MSTVCHAFGLPIVTEVAIPGAVPAGIAALPSGAEPAFTVVRGEVSFTWNEAATAEERNGPYSVGSDGFLFEKRGIARFFCPWGGERLIVDTEPGVAAEEVSAYLIATAIPALLWMRAEIVLHGAVALLPGASRAIGMLGVSGSGKSRLLREIVEAGGAVVAEDSFRVWQEAQSLWAAGLPGLIHGRAAGATLEAPRTVFEVPSAQQRLAGELSALVILEPTREFHEGHRPSREITADPVKLHDVAAFAALLRNRHRHRVPDLLGQSAGLLPRYGALTRRLPVYSWEFLRASLRSPGKGGTWRTLAGLRVEEDLT